MALPGFKVVTLTDAAANRVKDIIGKAWLSYWPLEELGVIPDSESSFAAAHGG